MPTTDFTVHDGLLAVQQTSAGEQLHIDLEGEMDLANVETAATTLREALQGGKAVVIDLSRLEFLDSTGIAMLVKALEEGGERLSFLPSEHEAVRRLLELTGLEERMSFAPRSRLRRSAEEAGAEPMLPAA